VSFITSDLSQVPQIARDAAAAVVPPFSTMMPKSEAGAPVPGAVDAITRPDHQHPRLTATAKGALDANGLATVVFTQVFDNEPAITVISVGARSAQKSVPDFDVTFTQDGAGKFTGCTVYGRRARALPQQTQLNVLSVLTGVIAGVNTIATTLGGYDPTEPAAGAGFSLIAVKSSA